MIVEDIKRQFNAVSEVYDRQRRELIPCFDEFYKVSVEISKQIKNPKKILDLGAGTGLMSAFFFETYPEAEFTLVDLSEEMLNKAKDRFVNFSNFNYKVEDFSELNFEAETFDLIISGLAIHHLDDSLKKKLFQKVEKFLKKDGWFINADQVLGKNKISEKIYTETWKNKVLENKNLTKEEKESAFERIKLDKMSSLENQLKWLEETGLQSPNCYYQYYNFVVFAAKK